MFTRLTAAIAVIALVCSSSAFAQTQTVPFGQPPVVTGTLTTAGDYVPINVPGGKWATAVWSIVGTAGTATITAEISIDGGTNWLPSAYSKRLDVVSANPTISPWVATAGITGSLWETPLPGNATQFRLRCGGTGTTTNVQLFGGAPYVPGVPVTAVLYDVAEGTIGAGIAVYVQDTSGWNSVAVIATSPTTQGVTVRQLDDAGSVMTGGTANFAVPGSGTAVFTRSGGNTTSNVIGALGQNLYATLTRRMQWSLGAGGTVSTGRIRVEASR